MLSRLYSTIAILVSILSLTQVAARDSITFCKDDGCGDCQVAITTIGTGYPGCAIHNSVHIFGNQGFPETDRRCNIQLLYRS